MWRLSRRVPQVWRSLAPTKRCKTNTVRPDFTWAAPLPMDQAKYSPEDVFRAGMKHHHLCNTAFPIAHKKTTTPYRVPRTKDQSEIKKVLRGAYGDHDELMLYVHVPFCQTRCQFCEYTVVDPKVGKERDPQTAYFDALIHEFAQYDELLDTKNKKLVGFDIGGGTPSMAKSSDIGRVMDAVHRHWNADLETMEISIETTPKIAAAEPQKMKDYFAMGIRRISMGLQTTDFRQAQEMNRDDANASTDYLQLAVDNIRNAGFESFNIDLMYGFPLRAGREDPWAQTVRDTIALGPEHVTLYRMRYKGTLMAHLSDRVTLRQVNDQEAMARQILSDAGYSGMIGKNTYSKVCGNSGCSDYLDKRVVKAIPYIGLGLGAQSFSHHTLDYNLGAVTKKLEQYIRSVELDRIPVQDLYHFPKELAIAKMASVSFYFGGIELEAFKNCFNVDLLDTFPDEVTFLVKRGLMIMDTDDKGFQRLQMTKLGKQCFGGVVAQFYSPAVKNHIMQLPGGETFAHDPVAALRDNECPFTPLTRDEVTPRKRRRGSRPSPAATANRRFMSTHSYNEAEDSMRKDAFEFGNILFSGPCNQKCPFCIGHQLEHTPNNLREWPLRNIDSFVRLMNESDTKKIILTGTRTDPQLYKHEKKLLQLLRNRIDKSHISLHTNGLLADRKLETFNMYDTVTVSINSFDPDTYFTMHGVKAMPRLDVILEKARIPVKLSCVINEHNANEVERYIDITSRIGVKRLAMRRVLDPYRSVHENDLISNTVDKYFARLTPIKYHQGNPVFGINGLEITYWKFEATRGKSINLFSDGVISGHYLLSKRREQLLSQ